MDALDEGIFNSTDIPLLGRAEVVRYADMFAYSLDRRSAKFFTAGGMATRVVKDIVGGDRAAGVPSWGGKTAGLQREVFLERWIPLVIAELASLGYLVKQSKDGMRVYPNPNRLASNPNAPVSYRQPEAVQTDIF